jgi:hypothetical protein
VSSLASQLPCSSLALDRRKGNRRGSNWRNNGSESFGKGLDLFGCPEMNITSGQIDIWAGSHIQPPFAVSPCGLLAFWKNTYLLIIRTRLWAVAPILRQGFIEAIEVAKILPRLGDDVRPVFIFWNIVHSNDGSGGSASSLSSVAIHSHRLSALVSAS